MEYSIVNVKLLLQMPGCTLANFYIPFLTLGYSIWSKLLQMANSSKTRSPYVVSTQYIFAYKSSHVVLFTGI